MLTHRQRSCRTQLQLETDVISAVCNLCTVLIVTPPEPVGGAEIIAIVTAAVTAVLGRYCQYRRSLLL